MLFLTCRRMCAYNFPCFVKSYHKDQFNEKLMPILEKFCSDSDEEVRSTIGAGFHEIVRLRPDEPNLLMPFIELIRGGAADVVQHLTGNLDKTLPSLYQCLKKGNSQVNLKLLVYSCWFYLECYSNTIGPYFAWLQSSDPFNWCLALAWSLPIKYGSDAQSNPNKRSICLFCSIVQTRSFGIGKHIDFVKCNATFF